MGDHYFLLHDSQPLSGHVPPKDILWKFLFQTHIHDLLTVRLLGKLERKKNSCCCVLVMSVWLFQLFLLLWVSFLFSWWIWVPKWNLMIEIMEHNWCDFKKKLSGGFKQLMSPCSIITNNGTTTTNTAEVSRTLNAQEQQQKNRSRSWEATRSSEVFRLKWYLMLLAVHED